MKIFLSLLIRYDDRGASIGIIRIAIYSGGIADLVKQAKRDSDRPDIFAPSERSR